MPSLPLLLLALCMVTGTLGQSCDAGTFFDGTQCSPCDGACASCISASVCTMCHEQAFLGIHNEGLACQLCSELLPGCAVCAADKTCSACSEGFTLGSNGCEHGETAGGQVTLSAGAVSCQSFQVEINGACHPSIALCEHYNPDASCSTCQEGTLLIQGYCIPSAIANFQAPSSPSPSVDLACESRQYISNGECVTMGPACLSFLINGTCTECDQGFTLFRGLCVQNGDSDQVVISYIPTLQSQAAHEETADNQVPPEKVANNQDHNSTPPTNTNHQASACNPPCETCSQDPSYCQTCKEGFAMVDSLPGQCFQF